MKENIIRIIISEVNSIIDDPVEDMNKDAVLFGEGGLLDSMGLVSMLVAVEQDVDDEYDIQITIADAKAMSQRNSPFRTVETLSDYIISLIKDVE